eukprot:gene25257-30829_t
MSYERNTLYRTFTRRAPDELSAALEKKKGKLTSPNFQLVLDSNQAITHVEIMIRVTDDDWRMFSINMMEAKRDHPDDPIVYDWGKLDHKFNFAGYVMNHVVPCAIGVRNGAKLEPRENTRYMCAELVMIALQMGQ